MLYLWARRWAQVEERGQVYKGVPQEVSQADGQSKRQLQATGEEVTDHDKTPFQQGCHDLSVTKNAELNFQTQQKTSG